MVGMDINGYGWIFLCMICMVGMDKGYVLHGIFTGEFCDEGTKGLSNWKAIEGRVGSL